MMILTLTASIHAQSRLPAPRPVHSPVVEEDTDDEDAESVGFSVRDDTVSVIENPADVPVPRFEGFHSRGVVTVDGCQPRAQEEL